MYDSRCYINNRNNDDEVLQVNRQVKVQKHTGWIIHTVGLRRQKSLLAETEAKVWGGQPRRVSHECGTEGRNKQNNMGRAGILAEIWSCTHLRCTSGSEDNRAEGDLVLWPPVSRQQRLLHLAKAEQEGEEEPYNLWWHNLTPRTDVNEPSEAN